HDEAYAERNTGDADERANRPLTNIRGNEVIHAVTTIRQQTAKSKEQEAGRRRQEQDAGGRLQEAGGRRQDSGRRRQSAGRLTHGTSEINNDK
ncbi:MAG: hypothetical protein LC775_08035, partial [Acidobacteria bacterium]|nr:hypothetical protein [Acidobacteriota bacterium]